MKDESIFWDNTAQKYAAKPVPSEENYQEKLKSTQELFSPEMRVLEIGCGTGTTSLIHAPYVKQIIATDFSKEMVAIAKEKAVAQDIANVEFRQESVQEMSFQDEEFDVIMAHSILHLVEDRKTVLVKIFRSLKPGGHFITNTGCIGGALKIFKPLWYIGFSLGKLPYIGFFSKTEFENEVKNCGFKIERNWSPTKVDLFLIAKK